MNKNEFLQAVAEKAEISQVEAKKIFEAMVEITTETLKTGDSISMIGLATVELRNKPAREGINPATKEKIQIAASKAPAVKFSSAYKKSFN